MVYRDTRIVSFYIAIYQYTGNIAHPYNLCCKVACGGYFKTYLTSAVITFTM